MSTFPAELDPALDRTLTDTIAPGDVNELDARTRALEAKVGAEGSPVVTSHDYRLRALEAADPAGTAVTTDATWTTVLTLALAAVSTKALNAVVSAIRSTGTEGGAWAFVAGFRRGAAGAPVQLGAAVFSLAAADDATWDVRIQVSGSDVVIQVRGAAGKTVRWRVEAAVAEARV